MPHDFFIELLPSEGLQFQGEAVPVPPVANATNDNYQLPPLANKCGECKLMLIPVVVIVCVIVYAVAWDHGPAWWHRTASTSLS